nr:MAG TPA: hypothetical protein [Caudoviricetes sp.]
MRCGYCPFHFLRWEMFPFERDANIIGYFETTKRLTLINYDLTMNLVQVSTNQAVSYLQCTSHLLTV